MKQIRQTWKRKKGCKTKRMETLPENCLAQIASLLDVRDSCSLRRVSRHFSQAMTGDQVWRELYLRDFPSALFAQAQSEASGPRFWWRRYVHDYSWVSVFESAPGESSAVVESITAGGCVNRVVVRPPSETEKLEGVRYLKGPALIVGLEFARQARARSIRYCQFRLRPDMTGVCVEAVLPLQVRAHGAVLSCLPKNEPRYGILVVDAPYVALNGGKTRYNGSKVAVLWLIWAPEACSVRLKMALASQSLPVKNALNVANIVEIQANAIEEAGIAAVAEKLDWTFLGQ